MQPAKRQFCLAARVLSALSVGVTVRFLQPRLVHVLMGVFGPVGVSVGVLVLHVVMLVGCVRVGVRHVAVLMLVRVWRVVGVLFVHRWCLLA